MEIKPLYIPLKLLKGKLNHSQTLSFKARTAIKRYGKAPKGRRGDNYNVMHKPDAEAIRTMEELEDFLYPRTGRVYGAAASKDEDKASRIMCKLQVSLRFLFKAWLRERKSWDEIEIAFYHINSEYLAMHRLAYGEDVYYKNHEDVACSDHFIEPKQRRFGKRIKAK